MNLTPEQVKRRLQHERVLNTRTAATELGVARITIHKWVERGHLHPVPGVTPRVYFEADLLLCQAQRRPHTARQRAAEAARRWSGV